MPNTHDVTAIKRALDQSNGKDEFRRVLCVWLRETLSLTSSQIAVALGQTPAAVRRVQSRFARYGLEAITGKRRGGRRRANISLPREKQIIHKFLRQARRGAVLNVSEIHKAYELSAGKTVSLSTIYRLIARHGLRRYLPRARSSR